MRYRIVNKFRFITFVTVVILTIALTFTGVFNTVKALESDEEQFIELSVCEGDTLWDIARNYGSKNMDIRKVVYQIDQINNLDAATIYPGQVLIIPVL